ncbi:MAG: VWA domain-containing protein [Rhizobiales bacterium]|nr:VWA domain-containing protein [Hyphomicrobiales bacterium]
MTQPDQNRERFRRWRLALGDDDDTASLSDRDRRIDQALSALYGTGEERSKKGGLGASSPRVARWLGDIREFFPSPVVQVIQKDAFERLGLKRMLHEPEFLASFEADVHLVADLMSLGRAIPEKTKETARQVIGKVVDELMAKLAQKTTEAIRGAVNKAKRTNRPRQTDIDWPRTIRANLRHYQSAHASIVPEKLIGYARKVRRADLDDIILCVDQSGSMATSVVYSSIFAAVMASIPAVSTKFVVFDTAVVDLTEKLADPVDVLFGVQLGGGTDINRALAYVRDLVQRPANTHLLLITDLFEGGNKQEMLARAEEAVQAGINLIVLLALSDDGKPAYDADAAQFIAALGCPVFACTPDQFPDMMAVALQRGDIQAWASAQGVATVRGQG